MSLRAIIVDDEALARTALLRLLKSERDITVVSHCGDGESAVHAIRQLQPDLVFLDVQMPEMNGFQRDLPAAHQLARRDCDYENQSGSAWLGELLSDRPLNKPTQSALFAANFAGNDPGAGAPQSLNYSSDYPA
jgi:hypothetical protein